MPEWLHFFERQSLRTKLATGFVVWLALLLMLNAFSIHTQQQLQVQMQQSYETDMVGVSRSKEIQAQSILLGRVVRQALLAGNATQRAEMLQQLTQICNRIVQEINALQKLPLPAPTQAALQRFRSGYEQYVRQLEAQVVPLLQQGQTAQAIVQFNSSAIAHWGGCDHGDQPSGRTIRSTSPPNHAAGAATSARGPAPELSTAGFGCAGRHGLGLGDGGVHSPPD